MTEADYQAAADRLGVPIAAVKAVAEVESSGVSFWTINGEQKPPVRLEAHWFGKFTAYRFNDSPPQISSKKWTPALAATTHSGAWGQVEVAAGLDKEAAYKATSWGAFQIMGMHFDRLGYASAEDFANSQYTEQGQLDAFICFIHADPVLLDSLRRQDWQAFAGRYNGPGQVDYYAGRMAAAFERHSA